MGSLSKKLAAHHGSKQLKSLKNLALVLAIKDEIEDALNQGWSLKIIHEVLKEIGKFPDNYQALWRAAKAAGIKRSRNQADTRQIETVAEPQRNGPIIATVESKKFIYNKNKIF